MARKYTLKRRAEAKAETRQRIVEAAVDLHSSVGPANTTLTMVAERAGVQRHTLYAHFPDERSLFLACSGLAMERDPLPLAQPWLQVADLRERRRAGLVALYGWYARNASLAACVTRDAEHHALTREMAELRQGPFFDEARAVLGSGELDVAGRAMLDLALSFAAWRVLVGDGGMTNEAAAEAMARAIDCAR